MKRGKSSTEKKTAESIATQFGNAVEEAEFLALKMGFQALKKSEGKDKISCADNRKLLGSVNIDDDCRQAYPNSSRWDYLVGISQGNKPVAHYIEVHTANSREVSRLKKKLRWLKDFVAAQEKLHMLDAKYYWVASGRIKIPSHTPQYRALVALRKQGLTGPVKSLTLL